MSDITEEIYYTRKRANTELMGVVNQYFDNRLRMKEFENRYTQEKADYEQRRADSKQDHLWRLQEDDKHKRDNPDWTGKMFVNDDEKTGYFWEQKENGEWKQVKFKRREKPDNDFDKRFVETYSDDGKITGWRDVNDIQKYTPFDKDDHKQRSDAQIEHLQKELNLRENSTVRTQERIADIKTSATIRSNSGLSSNIQKELNRKKENIGGMEYLFVLDTDGNVEKIMFEVMNDKLVNGLGQEIDPHSCITPTEARRISGGVDLIKDHGGNFSIRLRQIQQTKTLANPTQTTTNNQPTNDITGLYDLSKWKRP